VIAHADAQTSGNPPHHDAKDQRLPGEKEYGSERAQMQRDHNGGNAPINGLGKSSVLFQRRKEAHSRSSTVTGSRVNAWEIVEALYKNNIEISPGLLS
jgi:hypothetical protein